MEGKKGLGTKHECFSCGAKFFDLCRPQAICPRCGADQKEATVAGGDAVDDQPPLRVKKIDIADKPKRAVDDDDVDEDDLDEDEDVDVDDDDDDEEEGGDEGDEEDDDDELDADADDLDDLDDELDEDLDDEED